MIRKIISKLRGEPNLQKLKNNGLTIGNNFHHGKHCFFDPSHCWLISIGNNVTFSTRVHLLAHDASTKKLLGYTKIGRVDIEDNVFIGANVTILPSVSIGSNSVIGAGSVITKSIPSNVVAAGVPAKIICTIEEYKDKVIKNSQNLKFEEDYTLKSGITEAKKQEMKEKLRGGRVGLVR